MELGGVATNVTAFCAFVDVGVHQDGLVHVSQLADRFVKDPHEVVKVGDKVKVKVVEVDLPRKRIALTARSGAVQGQRPGAGGASGGGGGGGGSGGRGPQGRPDTRGDRGQRPAPKAPEQPKFANNPFAQAFGKPRGRARSPRLSCGHGALGLR